MPRVRLPVVLIAVLGLSLAACGGSENGSKATEPATPTADDPVAAPPAMMPEDAPPQEEAPPRSGTAVAGPASCRDEVGEAASARLVARCIAVSPATRPPCNALNPCEMIQGEIDRSCGQYGPGEQKPAECAA